MARNQQVYSLNEDDLSRLYRLGKQLYPNTGNRFKTPTLRTALKVLELVLARNNGQLPADMREAMKGE